jgi:putative hydrolase
VVPSVEEIRAKFSARRHSGSRIEQAIRRILGIDLKMKQYEQGARFVKTVVDEAGMEVFNKVWTSPETLPTRDEITSPRSWLERVGGQAPGELPVGEANGSGTNGAGGIDGSETNGSGTAAG